MRNEDLVNKGWAEMSSTLDVEMPVKNKRRFIWLWFFGALGFLSAIGLAWYQHDEPAENILIADIGQAESQSNHDDSVVQRLSDDQVSDTQFDTDLKKNTSSDMTFESSQLNQIAPRSTKVTITKLNYSNPDISRSLLTNQKPFVEYQKDIVGRNTISRAQQILPTKHIDITPKQLDRRKSEVQKSIAIESQGLRTIELTNPNRMLEVPFAEPIKFAQNKAWSSYLLFSSVYVPSLKNFGYQFGGGIDLSVGSRFIHGPSVYYSSFSLANSDSFSDALGADIEIAGEVDTELEEGTNAADMRNASIDEFFANNLKQLHLAYGVDYRASDLLSISLDAGGSYGFNKLEQASALTNFGAIPEPISEVNQFRYFINIGLNLNLTSAFDIQLSFQKYFDKYYQIDLQQSSLDYLSFGAKYRLN